MTQNTRIFLYIKDIPHIFQRSMLPIYDIYMRELFIKFQLANKYSEPQFQSSPSCLSHPKIAYPKLLFFVLQQTGKTLSRISTPPSSHHLTSPRLLTITIPSQAVRQWQNLPSRLVARPNQPSQLLTLLYSTPFYITAIRRHDIETRIPKWR